MKNPTRTKNEKRQYYAAHRIHLREQARHRYWKESGRRRVQEIAYRVDSRKKALKAYGGEYPECACCGESIEKFLTIDHIGGGRKQHRSDTGKQIGGGGLYIWLAKHNYPTGFRVLCMNCNWGIGMYGNCPHQDKGVSNLGKQNWTPFMKSKICSETKNPKILERTLF